MIPNLDLAQLQENAHRTHSHLTKIRMLELTQVLARGRGTIKLQLQVRCGLRYQHRPAGSTTNMLHITQKIGEFSQLGPLTFGGSLNRVRPWRRLVPRSLATSHSRSWSNCHANLPPIVFGFTSNIYTELRSSCEPSTVPCGCSVLKALIFHFQRNVC